MFINVLTDGDPDETISSRAARAAQQGKGWGIEMSKFLDLFQKDHAAPRLKPAIRFGPRMWLRPSKRRAIWTRKESDMSHPIYVEPNSASFHVVPAQYASLQAELHGEIRGYLISCWTPQVARQPSRMSISRGPTTEPRTLDRHGRQEARLAYRALPERCDFRHAAKTATRRRTIQLTGRSWVK